MVRRAKQGRTPALHIDHAPSMLHIRADDEGGAERPAIHTAKLGSMVLTADGGGGGGGGGGGNGSTGHRGSSGSNATRSSSAGNGGWCVAT